MMTLTVFASIQQVLEIIEDKARVIRSERDTFTKFHVVDYTDRKSVV